MTAAHHLTKPGVFASHPEEAQRERWAQGFRIAKMHADVFNSEAGQVLLAHWVQVFLARSIVRPGEDAFAQGIREGQADVVRQILAQLDMARLGPGGHDG